MSRSDRSMPLRDSFSERMEGTGSWDALEWIKIKPVLLSNSYMNLEFLIEAEQVIVEGSSKQTCSLLVVTRGKVSESKRKKDVPENQPLYPSPELVSSGHLEVQTLTNPSKEEFSKLLESYKPNLVYLQGEQLGNDEVGPLVWGDVDLLTL
ncbi:hypothetical protein L484_016350 [Morus notabilis]|uniref:Uncharacterized protein n=1 Tax=Morus notabilis TaxID=981085 RepID=W9QZK1_9ROSA|nr:hypothetical protein L484_016350 [Morus notabilis]